MKFIAMIPSYNRSFILNRTIKNICCVKDIESIVLVIQYSDVKERERYRRLKENIFNHCGKEVVSIEYNRPIGSSKARKIGLDIISQVFSGNYGVMILEDDFILPKDECMFKILQKDFSLSHKIGCVIGKVVDLGKRKIDPDFYFNSPALAESLTRITGYVFISRPIYDTLIKTIFGPQFMTIKLSVIKSGINYDKLYLGTGFREESDLQMQLYNKGYITLFDSRVRVYHLVLEYGGNRTIINVSLRSYWKARNHFYFLRKYFKGAKMVYYMLISALLLSFYNPFAFPWILKGIKDSGRNYKLPNTTI